MSMNLRGKTAIVGVGSSSYYARGQSVPQTPMELACKAILAAVEDAGVSVADIDGFAYYSGGFDSGLFAQVLGIPEIRFSASLTGGGSGSAGSIGLAAAAIVSGHAHCVVSVMTLQQVPERRWGTLAAAKPGGAQPTPEASFYIP